MTVEVILETREKKHFGTNDVHRDGNALVVDPVAGDTVVYNWDKVIYYTQDED